MSSTDSSEASFTIEDVAQRLGHLRWLELSLFEMLGEAVTEISDAPAKLAASLLSRRAGERAEHLGVVIPLINGLDVEARTIPPGSEVSESDVATVVAAARATPASERLEAATRRIVPLVAQDYETLLGGTGPVADAPVRRVARLCRDDLAEWGKSD
ncbi:MAG: hypothetical protein M5U31_05705 [Acidimicrobiia bacterium]|nr:hypothetical protein [Acidimicrobiia bacterium]